MKIAIVGSRAFNDYEKLKKFIFSKIDLVEIGLVVSGGAKGADKLAERFAEEHKIPVKIFQAQWNKHKKAAGIMRNIEIVDNSNIVFAFWDGLSKGTKHTIDIAKNMNRALHIYSF